MSKMGKGRVPNVGASRWLALRPPKVPETMPARAAYDLWAKSYRPNMNAVQVLEAEALNRLLPDLGGRRVLDLGCGRARLSGLAIERGAKSVVGLDFSLEMLRHASAELPSLTLVGADVTALPFEPCSFDAIVCALVLGHIPDLSHVLNEIGSLLRPGGYLVISDFHPYATLRGWKRTFVDAASGCEYAIEHHAHLLGRYFEILRQSAIEVEQLEEPLYDGFPLVFVFRARKAVGSSDF